MSRLILYICCVALLVGCTKKKPRQRPNYVLPQDSMAMILSEVHLLNAVSQHRESRRQHFQKFVEAEQKVLFDSLGVPMARFDSSMTFWLQDPKKMKEIYDESMNVLSTRLAQVKRPSPDSVVRHGGADKTIKEMIERDRKLLNLNLK